MSFYNGSGDSAFAVSWLCFDFWVTIFFRFHTLVDIRVGRLELSCAVSFAVGCSFEHVACFASEIVASEIVAKDHTMIYHTNLINHTGFSSKS